MGLLAVIFMVAICISKVEGVAFTVTYICDRQTLTFSASEAAGKLKAVYVPTKYVSCGTHATAGTKVAFDINAGTSASPAKGTITSGDATPCNYQTDASDATQRTVKLYLLEKAGIISTTDGTVTLSCKTDDQKSAQKTATVSQIDGSLSGDVTATKADPGLQLAMIPSNTAGTALHDITTPNPVTLGGPYVIVGQLDVGAASIATKVLLTECKAMPGGGTTPTVVITTTSGCLDTSEGVVPVTANALIPTSHSDATNNKYIAKTAAFKAFMVPDSTALTIECKALICASGTACDPVACGARRRRSAGQHEGMRNATLRTTIYIDTNPHRKDKAAHGHMPNFESCLSHVSFISVVAILAVLLVVSLAVSVFFCSKLIRQNNNNQQKEAYPNLAYKA